MTMQCLLLFICSLLSLTPAAAAASVLVHHELTVSLMPAENRLAVVDTITLPKTPEREFAFFLHSGLTPSSRTPGAVMEKQGEMQAAVPLSAYTVVLPPGARSFTVFYEGAIHHPVESKGQEQARGFEESPGIIAAEGVFLSAASGWYPDFRSPFLSFELEADLPTGWDAVSQGERVIHEHTQDRTRVRWSSPEPQDEIYLVANRFTEYSRVTGTVSAMAFLREPDDGLANRYLDATAAYVGMYGRLIGPYPYRKFALVENFWETGLGMPSFTLLGPKVVRLPFILHSSFPHEILHSWWGNSVYPDLLRGNWSEGLTAYLADHLIKEQQQAGAEYRLNTLQKYADYVLENRDFPLTQFRSRHSSSSEAIGYGKSLLFFHMLRRNLGDPLFTRGLRHFYRKNRFRTASFDDLRVSFETVAKRGLKDEFARWTEQPGAPELQLGPVNVAAEGSAFVLATSLEQVQAEEPFHLAVPVAVTLEGRDRAFQAFIDMRSVKEEVRLTLPARPLRIDIDPEYDLFRRLGRDEIPPAISQALGSRSLLIVLPSAADSALLAAYRQFAEGLGRSGPDEAEMVLDTDLRELPTDRALAVLGWENRFLNEMMSTVSGYGVLAGPQSLLINRTEVPRHDHAFVLTSRVPGDSDLAILFAASDRADALAGLGQKLPHYHKYSYLAFEGAEPANVAKGRWPVLNSPLTAFLPNSEGNAFAVDMAALAPREPLAQLPSAFSRERMMRDVRALSHPRLGGRAFGSSGLARAADLIAQEFRKAGLAPGGDNESDWFQTWPETGGSPAKKSVMKNVVGVLPGRRQDLRTQSVVVGAHYDHLGTGWPETRDRNKGSIHPGADDNASGVAVLLELARALAKGPRPDRSIVFVAFSGEETGRLGSRYYITNNRLYPADQAIGMINLDTVGRLGRKKLLVLGAGSAREWVHIFRGAGFVTGVEIETVSQELDSSDQKSFQEAGIPAVQLFSGPHLDYHRSTDTADRVDADGLVKVASVAKEAIEYLAGRQDRLTGPGTKGADASAQRTERKVSIGTVPDFAYEGKGFRISGVTPGTPAEQAGLREGDIIIRMNVSPVQGLKGYSDIMKKLKPGETVKIFYLRNGKEVLVDITVKER